MTIVIALAFALIVAALVVAGVFMLKGGECASASGRMMRALAVRIAASVALFACILIAWQLGWISPGGIPAGR